jgi:hypothetical protein
MVECSVLVNVYEYCDQWCEECPLQRKCALVQSPPEEDLGKTLIDLLSPDKSFLDDVSVFRSEHPLVGDTVQWFWQFHDWLGTCFMDGQSFDERARRVSWHANIVLIKIGRAVSMNPSEGFLAGSDAMGSAKVATLSLGKILDVLMQWCPIHKLDRQALRLLHHCSQLLDNIEATFPHHLHFRRPGFDTGALVKRVVLPAPR